MFTSQTNKKPVGTKPNLQSMLKQKILPSDEKHEHTLEMKGGKRKRTQCSDSQQKYLNLKIPFVPSFVLGLEHFYLDKRENMGRFLYYLN